MCLQGNATFSQLLRNSFAIPSQIRRFDTPARAESWGFTTLSQLFATRSHLFRNSFANPTIRYAGARRIVAFRNSFTTLSQNLCSSLATPSQL